MATIIISVGIDPGGAQVNLYTGPSYAAAHDALIEAGRKGEISEGWIFNNPVPVVHQFYYKYVVQPIILPEPQLPEVVKRPRGRPRKVAVV